MAVLAGEPLLSDSAQVRGREGDLLQLLSACAAGTQDALLAEARGTFAGAVFDPQVRRLTLFTDRLGIRPLYVCVSAERVVFATALRILEDSGLVRFTMDERAVTETVAFGYPLADRTVYGNVILLRPSERLTVTETVERRIYHESPSGEDRASGDVQTGRVHDAFVDAVRLRIGSDRTTAAFLSGGLDSRCVVAALRGLGRRVYTFNASLPDTLDRRLGSAFAAAVGTSHTEIAPSFGGPGYVRLAMLAWQGLSFGAPDPAERPALLWSGDGGSVTAGCVYLTPEIIARMRRGDIQGAIALYFQQQQIVPLTRLLTRSAAKRLRDSLHDGAEEEISRFLPREDPGRAFYLFLLYNDQHRHLATHFERLDIDRAEFQLPFFDRDFMDAMAAVPLDEALGHKFYGRWLQCFQPAVREVAWQAYPGHVPCPVPLPPGTHAQWSSSVRARARGARRRRMVGLAGRVLASPDFPGHLIRRSTLSLAGLAHALGIRDQEYLIRAASAYERAWARSRQ